MKILYVTTISLTMNSFFKPHIRMLVREGHTVEIACNSAELALDGLYDELGCVSHQIDFSRSPLARGNLRAYGQLKKVIEAGGYDIVHCHTPNASVVTRLVCRRFRRRNGLRVFYTAHGFHFYRGAPGLNWMVYYPVERLCARFTDKLITINKEDYELAKARFKAGEICYVPGVGVDLSRFRDVRVDRAAKRREIGVPEDAVLLFSVGELNENKNHQVIIRALARLADPNVHYAIAGVGDKRDELLSLAAELGVAEQVHLLGYRKDIPELNGTADVFCFPSYREGLGLAAIEAMTCGLPILTSNIHGINDYSVDGITGYQNAPTDVEGFARNLKRLVESREDRLRMGGHNAVSVEKYDMPSILRDLKAIYGL
jgi:glycosyltransferase involved in cell wall biosynthesis